jgi:hypothetical protein
VIGPGWMPTRPRPLPRPRGPLYWLARPRRRRAQAPAPARDASGASGSSESSHRDDAADACHTWRMLFEPRTKLPTATLLASSSLTRRRTELDRWLSLRWDWVRPRAVPLLAAFIGLLLTLAAVKYTSLLSYDHAQAQRRSVAPAANPAHRASRLPPLYQGLACHGRECTATCPRRTSH